MGTLQTGIIKRNYDYVSDGAKKTTGGIVVENIVREHDVIQLSHTITWTNENDWRTAFTPADGESGDMVLIFTDNDSTKRFQVFSFSRSGATTTLTSKVDIGNATTKIEVQNSSGGIQVRHTYGSNRSCSVKIGGVQDYVP